MNPAKNQPAHSFRALTLATGLFASLIVSALTAAKAGPLAGAITGAALLLFVFAATAPRRAACYANNFGVLTGSILMHEAFSLFMHDLLPLRDIVLDVSDPATGAVAAKPGATITIKDWRSDFTAYDVGAGGYNAPSNFVAGADTTVTLPNVAKAVSFVLTAAEYRVLSSGASGGADYMAFRDRLRLAMQQALGIAALTDMFAIITADNYENETVTAAGTFSRSSEIDLDTKLFTRRVPRVGAQAILSGATYGEWSKDHVAIQTNTEGGAMLPRDLLLDNGRQSMTTPFKFYRSSETLPAAAPRGFVMTKTAIVGTFRIPDEATYDRDPVSLEVVIDPKTKIPLLVRLWKNATTGAIQIDIAAIWKFQKGQGEALERLVAVATPEE